MEEKDLSMFQFRIARDFLFDQCVYPFAATYPLPDIPVSAQNQVVFTDKTGKILLQPFQTDTTYQLKDELKKPTGIAPVVENNILVLETNQLTKERDDYTYNITGTKNKSGLSKQLLRAVTLRVGVDINLVPVVQTSVIDYNATVDILVPGTQNGAVYQVVSLDGKTKLSDEFNSGEGGNLMMKTYPMQEDTPFNIFIKKVKAPVMSGTIVWKKDNPEMVVRVYPNILLKPVVTNLESGTDYNTVAEISLEGAQVSTDYQLINKGIDDDTVDKNTFINTLAGKSVKGTTTGLKLKTDKVVLEDPTVLIRATKRDSGITRDFPATIFIPVKPDPTKKMSIVEATVAKDQNATIRVNKPQRGVYYQLMTADNKEVGWRVYYHKNYGIGKARVEIEFAVDTKPDDSVYLATGPVSKDTVFKVVAKKATTGKTVEFVDTITVKLT